MRDAMVILDGVTKTYRTTGGGRRAVLRDATIAFPAGLKVGVLGPNGAGKSTLLRLIAGTEPTDQGRIHRHGRVSFPLGFTGTFHPDLSGRENLQFLARIYGLDARAMVDSVADFAELDSYMDAPIAQYSSGMLAKLAFGASLAIDFDVYLVDELTEVGDARFRARSVTAFRDRLRHASLILVSHNSQTIRSLCDCCAILWNGTLTAFDTVDEALDRYAELMGVADA